MPIQVSPETFDEDLLLYIESHKLDFNQGCIIKYVTRFQQKGEIADLLKARFYINRLITLREARAAAAAKEKETARRLEEMRNITYSAKDLTMRNITYSAKDLTMKLEANIPPSLRAPSKLGPISNETNYCQCDICKNLYS